MIKKLVVLNAVALVLIGAMAYVVSANALKTPEGTDGLIVGEVIDLATYAMKGERGDAAREPGIHNSGKHFPIGILEEETGDLYIAVYRDPAPASSMELANPILEKYMNKKVAAQGLLYKAPGLNFIRLSIVGEY